LNGELEMANPTSTPGKVPPPHEGAHYANPSSEPLESPVAKFDQEGTQRVVWKLFFVLMLCVVAIGTVFGLITSQP